MDLPRLPGHRLRVLATIDLVGIRTRPLASLRSQIEGTRPS